MTYEFEFKLEDGSEELWLAIPEFEWICGDITTPLGTYVQDAARLIGCDFIRIEDSKEKSVMLKKEMDETLLEALRESFERSPVFEQAVNKFLDNFERKS